MRVIITAGPTREHLDPVRFLSNPSTGKMGFALAAEAARRGHDVTLIAGPVALPTPPGVTRVDVVSARDMLFAAERALSSSLIPPPLDSSLIPHPSTLFIATAAVADWRPKCCATQKLKKAQMSSTLTLVRNPDILKTLARKYRSVHFVGFAAETNDVLAEAARKCRAKRLAFIVANDVTEKGCGFGTATNRVTLVFPDGTLKKFPLMTKRLVARRILDEASHL